MLTMPGGKPASLSRSPSRSAVKGVISEGLRTTVLPVASAGPNFHDAMTYNDVQRHSPGREKEKDTRGAFQGKMQP